MAEGGLRTDLLESFGDKLDQIYVKLGQMDDRLKKFENRQVKIELSKDSRATARALDELGRAFIRFSRADSDSLKAAGDNVSSFVNNINTSLGSIDASAQNVLSSVFKPFLLDLSDIFNVALDFSPAKIRAVKDTLFEAKDIFVTVGKMANQTASVNVVGLKAIQDIAKEVLVPLFTGLKDLLKTTGDISPQRIENLAKLLTILGDVFLRVRDITTSVGSVVSGAGPGAFVKVVGVFKYGILPLIKAILDIIKETSGLSSKRLTSLQSFFITLQTTITSLGFFAVSLATVSKDISIAGFIKLTLLFGVVKSLLEAIQKIGSAKNLNPAVLNALPNLFSSFSVAIRGFTQLQDAFKRSNIVSDFLSIFRASIFFGIITDALIKAVSKIAKATRGVDPNALAAVAPLFDALINMIDRFIRLQEEFKRSNILADFKPLFRSAILFGEIMENIAKGIAKIVKAVRGSDPAALLAVPPLLDSLIPVINRFTKMQEEFKRSNILEEAGALLRSVIIFSVITGVIATAVSKIAKGVRGTDPESLTALTPLFNALISVIRQFLDLQTAFNGSDLFADAGLLLRTWLIFSVIMDALINAVRDIVRATSGIDPKGLAAIGPLLNAMVRVVRQFVELQEEFKRSNIFADFASLFRAIILFSLITDAVANAAAKIVRSVRGTDPTALGHIGPLLNGITNAVKQFTQLQSEFKRSNIIEDFASLIRAMIMFSLITDSIAAALKKITNAVRGADPKVLKHLASLVEALGDAIGKFVTLANAFDIGHLIADLLKMVKAFIIFGIVSDALANALRKILRATQGTNPESLKETAAVISALSDVLEKMVAVYRESGGASFLTTMSKLLKVFFILNTLSGVIGNAVKNLVKAVKGVTAEQLSEARQVIEAIFKIAIDSSKDQNLDTIKLAKALKDLGTALKSFDIKPNAVKSLESLGKVLSGLSGTDQGVKALQGIFEALSRPEAKNIKDLSFGNLANELEKLVKVLKKLSSKELEALTASLSGSGANSLKNGIAETSKETKILGGRFEDLSDEISEGIVEGTIRVRILDTVVNGLKGTVNLLYKAFRNFNVVSLFSSATNAAAGFGNALKEIGDNIRDVGENIRDAGTNLIDNFGIGAITGSAAFTSAVDFDRISTQLQVFGGLNDEALERAQAFSNQIGIDYPLSANEALAATLDLIKAGLDLNQVEFVLPAAADLAALSDSGDIQATTNTLIAAANGFTVFGERAGELVGGFENIDVAANIISAAADVSTASVESLSDGLANVGPAANAFGLSLEETAAILAIFDQNAVSGAEGGTALRSLLNALGSDKSLRNLRALGISLFDPETGSRRPLNDIINDIGESLNNLPEAQRASVLQNLADTYGRQGLNILLNAGTDAINDTVDAMNGIAPASERAAQMLDNLAGDVEQLKGSWETLLVRVLLPTLDRFFRPFVKIVRFVVDGFLSLSDSVLTFVGSAIIISSLFATFIGALLVFVGVVLQVGGVLLIVVGVMINFGLVIAGVILGITAFIAGLTTILLTVTAILPIIVGVTAIFETLFKIFKEDAGGAATAARAFFGAIAGVGSSVISFLSSLFNLIGANARFFSRDGGGLTTFGTTIANFFNGLTESLDSGIIGRIRDNLNQVTQIFNTFAEVRRLFDRRRENTDAQDDVLGMRGMSESLAASTALIDTQVDNLINNLFMQNSLFRNAIENFFGSRGFEGLADADDFFDVFTEFTVNIAQRFDEVVQVFQRFVGDILDGVSFGEAFATLATDFDDAAGEFVRSIIDLLAVLFGPARFVQQLQFVFRGSLSDGLGRLIPLIIDNIRDSVIANRDTLKNIVTTLFSFFFAPLKSIRFFANLIGIEPLVRLVDFFQGIIQKLVGGLFDTVINILEGQSISEALLNAFGEGIGPLVRLGEALFNVVRVIGTAFSNLFGTFTTDRGNPLESFIDFFSRQIDRLADLINNFTEFILTPLAEGDFGAVLSNIGGVVVEQLSRFGDFIADFIGSLGIDFSGIGTIILNNLLAAVSASFTNLSEITGIDFTNVINILKTAIQSSADTLPTGPEGVFASVANTILGLLVAAIVGVFDSITAFTGIDFSATSSNLISVLEQTLDANLAAVQAGGVGGVFSTVANTIVGLLGAAITSALSGLADFIGLDTTTIQATLEDSLGGVFDSIQNLFQDTEEGDSIFTNIKQTIDNIVLAFTTLFDFFRSSGSTDTSGTNAALQVLLDFIGGLVGFGLDVISSLFKAVDDFFEGLSNLDGAQLSTLAAGIGSAAIAFFIFSGGLTAFATSAIAAAAPAIALVAGFIAVALVIKAVASNIGELFDVVEKLASGDILGAIGELFDALLVIFADIAFTLLDLISPILDFFGVEITGTADEVVEMGRSIANQLGLIFSLLGQKLADFVAIGIANLQLLASHAKAAAAGIFTDANENFDAVNIFFQETREFSLDALGEIKNAEVDAGVVANFALVNQDEISRQVREEITANIAAGISGIDADQVQTLIDIGALDRVLQDAIRRGDVDIVSAIFASGNQNIPEDQIQESINQIISAMENGFIANEQGINLLHLLGFDTTTIEPIEVEVPVDTELVPEPNAAEQMRADIEATRNAAQAELDAATIVPVDVSISTEVTPEVSAENFQAELAAETQAILDQINADATAQQEAIETQIGVEVQPLAFGLDNIAPETLPLLNADIVQLQTNLGLLQADLTNITPMLQTAVTEFDDLTTSLTDTDTIMLTMQTTAQLTLSTMTTGIINLGLAAALHINLVLLPALQGIIDKGAVIGTTFVGHINAAIVALNVFTTTANGSFNAIASGTAGAINSVNSLTKALVSADAAARSVGSAVDNVTATTGSIPPSVPGNAGGGSFREGDIRQIDEGGSEVLVENGKMYLIARNAGDIKTLKQSGLQDLSNARRSGSIPQATNQNYTTNTTSNIRVDVGGSSLSLTVNGSNLSAAEITQKVMPEVQRFMDSRDKKVKDILRTSGR